MEWAFEWFGLLCVALEISWLVWWCVIVGKATDAEEWATVNAGYASLTSPHAGLLIYVFANLDDMRKHCKVGDVCELEVPNYLWYFGALVCVPFDILQLRVNMKMFSGQVYWISLLTLIDSCIISAWSILVVFIYLKPKKTTEASNGIQKKLKF